MAEQVVADLEISEILVLELLMQHGFSPKDWKKLGMALKIPTTKIETIEVDSKGVEECLLNAITHWLRNGERSWKALWEALCTSFVGYKKVGHAVRDWYSDKSWNDKREGSRGLWIQLIRDDRRLQAIFHHTQQHKDGQRHYFRVLPERHLSGTSPDDSMFKRHYDDLKSRMTEYLEEVQNHQSRYKVGYEARFGHLYWNLLEGDHNKTKDISYFRRQKIQKIFTPQIEGSVGAVVSAKCVGTPLVKWLVDPLKFVVEHPAHDDLVYIAVVSQSLEGYFVLHEVYQQQKQGWRKKATFDIAQPRRSYDIRIADCCALRSQTDDPRVLSIAETITKSIQSLDINSEKNQEVGKLSMQLVGDGWYVKFFRHKKQQKHHWKDNTEWRLAEFDVAEFEMTDDLLQSSMNYDGVPVPFNTEVRKEIELWSRKQFPRDYDRSRVSAEENHDDKSTCHVSMDPWTTEDLLKDFENFVQAAFDITKILAK